MLTADSQHSTLRSQNKAESDTDVSCTAVSSEGSIVLQNEKELTCAGLGSVKRKLDSSSFS